MKISLERYAAVLYTIGKMEQQASRALKLKAFVGLLAREKKLNSLPRILEIYQRIYNTREHTASVTTYSARLLPSAFLATLKTVYTGTNLEYQHIVKPELIGGVALKINDDIVDMSVSGRLQQLQHVMSNF